jgi:hypothetical protein
MRPIQDDPANELLQAMNDIVAEVGDAWKLRERLGKVGAGKEPALERLLFRFAEARLSLRIEIGNEIAAKETLQTLSRRLVPAKRIREFIDATFLERAPIETLHSLLELGERTKDGKSGGLAESILSAISDSLAANWPKGSFNERERRRRKAIATNRLEALAAALPIMAGFVIAHDEREAAVVTTKPLEESGRRLRRADLAAKATLSGLWIATEAERSILAFALADGRWDERLRKGFLLVIRNLHLEIEKIIENDEFDADKPLDSVRPVLLMNRILDGSAEASDVVESMTKRIVRGDVEKKVSVLLAETELSGHEKMRILSEPPIF